MTWGLQRLTKHMAFEENEFSEKGCGQYEHVSANFILMKHAKKSSECEELCRSKTQRRPKEQPCLPPKATGLRFENPISASQKIHYHYG